MDVQFDIAPAPVAECLRLEAELDLSFPVAQVLVRRGLSDPAAARAFLQAADRHDPSEFAGIDVAVAMILDHVARGSRIVVHGDYDADGVCSTAILVRTLRSLGADAAWFLPSRTDDGYGLSMGTVERLAADGAGLIVTVDCAITAVEEVARAHELGLDVVVTDHHQPRADGRLPAAPTVHPMTGGYPTADLCAAGVAYKLAGALLQAAGRDPADADADLDIVALATVADCVPLRGENRRLVREGLVALGRSQRVGLRALMRVAQADPAAVDEQTIGFRLAPRINAAGRLHRADAGVELLLTERRRRAPRRSRANSTRPTPSAATSRRGSCSRPRRSSPSRASGRPTCWPGEDWHPGRHRDRRLADRRPSSPAGADDRAGRRTRHGLRSLDPRVRPARRPRRVRRALERHGGHRAAAGCTVRRDQVDALRSAFEAHAAAVLAPSDFVPRERVDAVVGGEALGMPLAEELARLAPFGIGNPRPSLLVPAARLTDPRQMGEGKHVRFTVESGGARAAAVAFGRPRLPDGHEQPLDTSFALEVNRWQGREDARLVLRESATPQVDGVTVIGRPERFLDAALAELDAPLVTARAPHRRRVLASSATVAERASPAR